MFDKGYTPNWTDIHNKVVAFIRKKYPDTIIIAQCREN